jgi:molecular chaperone DnaK
MGAAMYAAGQADASASAPGDATGTADDEDVVDAEIVDDEGDQK